MEKIDPPPTVVGVLVMLTILLFMVLVKAPTGWAIEKFFNMPPSLTADANAALTIVL
jgi:hypothetical protein